MCDRKKSNNGGGFNYDGTNIIQHGYQPTGNEKPLNEGYVPTGQGESSIKDSTPSNPPTGGSVQQDD